MISKQRTVQLFLFIACLLTALVICLPGCTNNVPQTTGSKTSTKLPAQTNGTYTSSTAPSNQTIPPTREIWPVRMPPDMTGRIIEMLRTIPDNQTISQDQVWFVDFTSWDTTLGINIDDYRKTSSIPTREEENAYLNDLIFSSLDTDDRIRSRWYPWLGQPPFISGMGSNYSIFYAHIFFEDNPVRAKFIGYGPLDVECGILTADVNQCLPSGYEAIKGSFDTTAINRAIEQYQGGYQQAQISSRDGTDIYLWDGEFDQRRSHSPPIFDKRGDGRTLAIQPNYIFGSREPAMVDEMIDVSEGRLPSLADDPLYQELATKLENMGSMSAVISVDKILKQDLWPGKSSFFEKAASYAPLMGPYNACAAGLSVDEKGMFVSLVLLYESPDQAEKDIKVLKERLAAGSNSMNSPWAKEVDDSEVWSDGKALCAKLYGNVTSYWDCFVHQEPLLVRETNE
jgi:hypothetical protein